MKNIGIRTDLIPLDNNKGFPEPHNDIFEKADAIVKSHGDGFIVFSYNHNTYDFKWEAERLQGFTKEQAWDIEVEINKTITSLYKNQP